MTHLDFQILTDALAGEPLSDLNDLRDRIASARDKYANDNSPLSVELCENADSLLQQLEEAPRAALGRIQSAYAIAQEESRKTASLLDLVEKRIAEERDGEGV
jgi:hypothetical protein